MKKTIRILLAILLVSVLALALAACNPCINGSHKWDDGEVLTPANCGVDGVKLLKCKICNETMQEVIPATGEHANVEKHEAQPHDECKSDGTVEYYECQDCGKLFSDEACEHEITQAETVDPAESHSVTIHHDEQQPGCTTDGAKEYWECDKCGALFSDANGKKKIDEPTSIPALKHRLVPNEEFGDHGFVWGENGESVVFHLVCIEGDATFEVDLSDRITVIDIEECGEPSRTVYVVLFDRNWTDLIDGNKIADSVKNPMDSTINIVHEDSINGHVLALTNDEWTWSTDSEVSITLYFECENCEKKISKDITAGITVDTEQATCVDAGKVSYKFSLSNAALAELLGYDTLAESVPAVLTANKEVTVNATGHKLTQKDATIGADCQTRGDVAHYECDNCGKWFADQDAEQELVGEARKGELGDHVFANKWESKDDETHRRQCANCDEYEEAAHVWSETALEDDDENHTFICEATGCDATKTEAHAFYRYNDGDDDCHWVLCEYCDYEDIEYHDFGSGDDRHDCDCGEPLCGETSSNEDVTYKHATSSTNVALNGVTIDVENVVSLVFTTFNGGNNAPQYNKSGYIQFYGGNQLTISWKGFEVTKIEFTFTSGKTGAIQIVSGGGKYSVSGTLGTWTSDENVSAAPIVLQNGTGSTQGQAQITQIKIYYTATVMVGHHIWEDCETIPATCTEPEYLKQTCKRCGATQTVETGEPATGHIYDNSTPTWTWNWENMTATATFKCDKCDHTETVADSELEETEATHEDCLNNRKSTYKAEVQFNEKTFNTTSEQRDVPETALGHDYTGREWAPLTGTEQHYKDCTRCESTGRTTENCNKDGLDHDENNHWAVCTVCGNDFGKTQTTPHDYNNDEGMCECGQKSPQHEHKWDENWTSDATGHWHKCLNGCGEIKEVVEESQSGPLAHKWSSTYKSDNTDHWQFCGDCLYENKEGKEVHVFNSYNENDDKTHTAICGTCDAHVELPHEFEDGQCKDCHTEEPAILVWKLVENASDLSVGDTIIIVATNQDYAMADQNTNYRNRGPVTKDSANNTLTFDDSAKIQQIVLEQGSVEGSFYFNVGNSEYLYAPGSGNSNYVYTNPMSTIGSDTTKASWKITISAGVATVQAQCTAGRTVLSHNNSQPRFSCYSAKQTDISVYKLSSGGNQGGTTDPVDPEQHECQSICDDCGFCTNLSCSEEACATKCEGNHNSGGGDTEQKDPVTLTLKPGTIGSDNKWTSGNDYSELPTGDANLTVTATGQAKYYSTGSGTWRIYSGNVVITALNGCKILSYKVTYSNGTFTNVTSGTLYQTTGTETIITIALSGTKNAQISELVIEYQPA